MKIKSLLLILLIFQALSINAQNYNSSYLLAKSGSGAVSIAQSGRQSTPYFCASQFNQLIAKEKKSHPMVKTGKILTYVGLPLMVIGGIMVASSDALYYECVNGVCEGDATGGFGIVILAAGTGLTGTGIILWTIGKKKSR